MIVITGDENLTADINRGFESYNGDAAAAPVLNVTFEGITTAVENQKQQTPSEFMLSQNYPNPFNPTTTIRYSIARDGYVELKVFNVLGVEEATLVNGPHNAGSYSVLFDASRLASGVYFYQLKAGEQIITRKMLLMK